MKVRRTLPPVSYLRACLRYEKHRGFLFWRVRPESHFHDARACKCWNTRYAGQRAFCTENAQGYFFGALDNKKYLTHRVIWKYVTGEEPPLIVDHIDRKPKNNRFKNFREATKSQNNINSTVKKGIWFDWRRGKWMAHIKINSKRKFLGRHETKRAAQAARKSAAIYYFGAFAP